MRKFLLISACFAMTACATTKPAVQVEVRPVTQSASQNQTSKFDAKSALSAANTLQNNADYFASYDAYKAVLLRIDKKHESRSQAMLGLADSALALSWHDGNYADQARKFYTKIAQIDASKDGLKRRAENGLLLLDLADFTPKAAKKHLHTALKHSQNDARLWNALGKVHDGEQDWLDALDAYIKALTAAKSGGQSTAAVVNNMGMSLLMQGRKKEALAKFKQAKKASPEMPVYDNNLRLAQTLSGKTDKALKGLSDTRTAQIYNDAGVIAQAQGNKTKAAHLYKKAIKTSPVYFELAEENLAGLG